jgi:hypothetical protein
MLKLVKITDDYRAKIKLWAMNPTVAPSPRAPVLPKFPPQRFSSHEEMNKWKQELLKQLARQGVTRG